MPYPTGLHHVPVILMAISAIADFTVREICYHSAHVQIGKILTDLEGLLENETHSAPDVTGHHRDEPQMVLNGGYPVTPQTTAVCIINSAVSKSTGYGFSSSSDDYLADQAESNRENEPEIIQLDGLDNRGDQL